MAKKTFEQLSQTPEEERRPLYFKTKQIFDRLVSTYGRDEVLLYIDREKQVIDNVVTEWLENNGTDPSLGISRDIFACLNYSQPKDFPKGPIKQVVRTTQRKVTPQKGEPTAKSFSQPKSQMQENNPDSAREAEGFRVMNEYLKQLREEGFDVSGDKK